jgi:hypothetical protein
LFHKASLQIDEFDRFLIFLERIERGTSMDGASDERYRASVHELRWELIVAPDDNGRIQTVSEWQWQVSKSADLQELAREIGLGFLAKMRTRFEAVRFETEDGRIFVYSVYDRACEFFGEKVLKVGQMPVFRAFLSHGLV